MATSTLSVRTLGLATIALVLACGHAVRGDGSYRIRPGSTGRGPAVANLGGSSRGAGVATFSSRNGSSTGVRSYSGSGGGRPVIRAASSRAPTGQSAQVHASNAPPSQPRAAPGTPVRRIVITSGAQAPKPAAKDWTQTARADARGQPAVLAALQTAPPAPALSRNAFSVGNVDRIRVATQTTQDPAAPQ